MRGMPDDPQLGVLDPAPGLEQHVEALVGAQQAEAQHDRACRSRNGARRRPAASARCAKAPCGITCTRAGSTPSSSISRARPCSECDDDRVEAVVQPPLRRAAGAGCGSRGSTSCAVSTSGGRRGPPARGSSRPSSCCTVSHWKCTTSARARGAAVAQHVGHVLGELQRARGRAAQPATPRARGAVEELAARDSRRRRHRAVGEAAREQLDVGPGSRQRAAQRVVVGRRVGGGVDDVDAHCDGQ